MSYLTKKVQEDTDQPSTNVMGYFALFFFGDSSEHLGMLHSKTGCYPQVLGAPPLHHPSAVLTRNAAYHSVIKVSICRITCHLCLCTYHMELQGAIQLRRERKKLLSIIYFKWFTRKIFCEIYFTPFPGAILPFK